MSRFLVALIVCWIAVGRASADGAIVWATNGTYPPFVTALGDTGPSGLDRDIADAVCGHLGRPCRFVATSWDDLRAGLMDGRYDIGFSGLTRGTVTAAGLDASRPYFTSGARFVLLEGNRFSVDPIGGFAVLGVLAGTPHAAYLESHVHDLARVRRFPDEEELYFSLLGGGVDAAFGDSLALYQALMSHPADLPVVFDGPVVVDPDFFDADVVFALAPGDPLTTSLDEAIAALDADGILSRIVERHLPGYLAGIDPSP